MIQCHPNGTLQRLASLRIIAPSILEGMIFVNLFFLDIAGVWVLEKS